MTINFYFQKYVMLLDRDYKYEFNVLKIFTFNFCFANNNSNI